MHSTASREQMNLYSDSKQLPCVKPGQAPAASWPLLEIFPLWCVRGPQWPKLKEGPYTRPYRNDPGWNGAPQERPEQRKRKAQKGSPTTVC
eukprot:4480732-Amphidinium_carterae.1